MLDKRKEKILQLVIENFIQTAEPVGSGFLVEVSGLDVSGATVRNEMRELEEMGYLTHPHTSSGRMPTEQGYSYYVDSIMKPKETSKKVREEIDHVLATIEGSSADRIKFVGKYTAEKINNAVIIAHGHDHIYYTGLSNLFSQPEFRDYAYTVQISTIFDQVEERLEEISELFEKDKPQVVVGEKNPFGRMCGLVGGRLKDDTLFTILGPLRMNYAKGYSFIDFVQKNINI